MTKRRNALPSKGSPLYGIPAAPPDPEPSRRSLTWIAISFTEFERAVIDELFRIGGFARLDDLVVAGLWQLAKQLDVPVTTFARRGTRDAKRAEFEAETVRTTKPR